MGKKSSKKEWRRLTGLKWDEAFLCNEKGKYLTHAEVANPDCDPWLKVRAHKNWESSEGSVPYCGYIFLCHPSSGEVFYQAFGPVQSEKFIKVKPNRKIYKKLIEILEGIEPKIKISGFRRGEAFLDTGFIYAPYIPMLKTPTFIDPNDFSLPKGLLTRFTKKIASPKLYNCVTSKSL